jgi:hypothetical protein
MKEKMQRAVLDFLNANNGVNNLTGQHTPQASRRDRNVTSRKVHRAAQDMLQTVERNRRAVIVQWDIKTGQMVEKRTRRRYDPLRRQIVAENRGNVCEIHRKAKTEVNSYPNTVKMLTKI